MKRETVQFWLRQLVYKQTPSNILNNTKEYKILKQEGLDIILDLEYILKESNDKTILFISSLLNDILEDKPKQLTENVQNLNKIKNLWLGYLSQSTNKNNENNEEE